MSADESQAPPTGVLRQEHQVILRVIAVLDRLVTKSQDGDGFEADAMGKCVEFFRLFADACHHAKEEDLLFPLLEQRGIPREGGPIGVMLEEHRMARGHTRNMADALKAYADGNQEALSTFHEAARHYIQLLRNHIFKEDNILFNMGDRVMTGDDRAALCERFCEVGCRAFEGRRREALEKIADDLEAEWGLS